MTALGLLSLLYGPAAHGLWRVDRLEVDAAKAVQGRGWTALQVDLSGVANKAGLMDRLSADLHFPDYFGKNWDALWDCLTDLVTPPLVFLVSNTAELAARDPGTTGTLLEILSDLCREHPPTSVIWEGTVPSGLPTLPLANGV